MSLDPDRPADWQLPAGVDRPLAEYLRVRSIAEDYDRCFATTNLLQTDVEYLQRHFQVPGRLIDLGCGTGRVLVHFARRGFRVVGVDLSRPMLQVVQRKQQAAGVPIHLIEGNLCDLGGIRSGSFRYACCMFSTLGMLVGLPARKQALAEIHRLLQPQGLFGLHVHNLWYNATDPVGRKWFVWDVCRRLWGSKDAGDKVQANYRGIPNLRIHLFTRREIRRLLTDAGFEIIDQTALAPDRAGPVEQGPLSWLHSNGWLIMTRKR